MAKYDVKVYNDNLEVYEYTISASSESVARMRAMTMYRHVNSYSMIRKVQIRERKRGF